MLKLGGRKIKTGDIGYFNKYINYYELISLILTEHKEKC